MTSGVESCKCQCKKTHKNKKYFIFNINKIPIPVAARSKVCDRSSAETVVQNPTAAQMSVCCECCVLSGRSLCDELMAHPKEFYVLWSVVVCDLETP
jgi:hypothetical protein